jgi:protein TonB
MARTSSARLNVARWNIMAGMVVVVAMHGAALYGLWSCRLLPAPDQAVTLFVNLINPPPEQKKPEVIPSPLPRIKLVKPRPIITPPLPLLAANAPAITPDEPVVPSPPTMPLPAIAASPEPSLSEPVATVPPVPPASVVMSSDLSVACPDRSPPAYPVLSRRMGEQGRVVLQVELDEDGHVAAAKVKESSGHSRLDEAGLAAVRKWHCSAPTRNGEPMHAVAMQPFNFVLEGRR